MSFWAIYLIILMSLTTCVSFGRFAIAKTFVEAGLLAFVLNVLGLIAVLKVTGVI